MTRHDPRDASLGNARQYVHLMQACLADGQADRADDAEAHALGLYALAGLDPAWLREPDATPPDIDSEAILVPASEADDRLRLVDDVEADAAPTGIAVDREALRSLGETV
jgi:hypothetical protein